MVELAKDEFDGVWSIYFVCNTPVDDAVRQAGGYPNGYFWDRAAQMLIASRAPDLAAKVSYDSEGSMFCAFGTDAEALDALALLMAPVVNDPKRMTDLLTEAQELGDDFTAWG